jgi:hypothetical protein
MLRLLSTAAMKTEPRTVLSRPSNGIGGTRVFLISNMLSLNLSTELALSWRLRDDLPASLPDLQSCNKGESL